MLTRSARLRKARPLSFARNVEPVRITDRHHIQSAGRCGDTGDRTIPRMQHFGGPIFISFVRTHLQERAGDVTDHMMQERICPDIQVDVSPAALDANVMHIAYRMASLARYGPVRGKIVLADQPLSGAMHGLRIQRFVGPGDALPLQCGAHAIAHYDVSVSTPLGAETRMEVVRNDPRPAEGDRFG